MAERDELLARADAMLDMIRRRDTAAVPGVVSLIRDLRATLAARPDLHVYDVMGVLWRPEKGSGPWSFRTQRAGRSYPEGHEFVIIYRRAMTGSATPDDQDAAERCEGGDWCALGWDFPHTLGDHVAGSATQIRDET